MDDLDSIASLTRQIEGVQIGITLTEKPDGTVRVSVRTTKEMDAAAICKKVGGRRSCPCGRCELHLRHGGGQGCYAEGGRGAVSCSKVT